ncbi:MAG TPA: hypothetical protein ENJ89_02260 [Caldithrix abyssi]|uniref:DUF4097 domain-containing protein n=1 Tax=Caldithrix abyssi TaxID=187145 RepID=A0A7V5PMV5_CALAY|nr:hypothetical protein [Caldithrix abyssi]
MRSIIAKTLLLLLGLFLISYGATLEETFKRRIPIEDIERLSVYNVNGSIKVSSWDQPAIEVVAYKKVRAGNTAQAERRLSELEIEIAETAEGLEVQTRFPRKTSGGGFFAWLLGESGSSASVNYEIKVPRKLDLELHSTNGKLVLTDCEGMIKLYTTNGKIEAENIRGTINARTTNGSINVLMDALQPEEGLRLRTTNGSIKLYLPADTNADLDAKTVNGSIRCELPLQERSYSSKKRLQGMINDGGPLIYLKTTNGSIRILER